MFVLLPPAASDREIAFTVPKEIDPYLVVFYQATKKAGENPSTFSLRLIKQAAKQWYTDDQLYTLREGQATERESDKADADAFMNS